jgi:hypothetical protein
MAGVVQLDEGVSAIEAIRKLKEPRHDTLYCTDKTKRSLLLNRTGTSNIQIDKICGLNIDPLRLPMGAPAAIVCKKGEVFPRTKDEYVSDI